MVVVLPAVRLEIVAVLNVEINGTPIIVLTVNELIVAVAAPNVDAVKLLTSNDVKLNEEGIVDTYGPPFILDKLILPTPVMAPVVDILRTLTEEI